MNNRTIPIYGRDLVYTLRKSKRAKHARIQLDPASGVILVVPRSFSESDIPAIFERNKEWLVKHLEAFEVKRERIPKRNYLPGELFHYLGKTYELGISYNDNRALCVSLKNNELVVNIPETATSEPLFIRGILGKWYRERARVEIVRRVNHYAEEMGLNFNRIAIKNQRTIWGSCSPKGNLNFNFRLVMAPEKVLEYIIVHELSHLQEPNHSPSFWDTVESILPDYRIHREWIKEHGAELVL